MEKVRVLRIVFDTPIKSHEITAFRGSMAQAVGYEHILFHNHPDADLKQYRYRYPLIQYKRIDGKAAMICIAEGTEALKTLLTRRIWKLSFSNKVHNTQMQRMDSQDFIPKIWVQARRYRLHKWLALNSKNYEQYFLIESQEKRIAFLNKILIANILAFCRAIKWYLEVEVKVNITEIIRMEQRPYKKVPLMVFDVRFITNVALPDHIGIGKGVSRGFGVVTKDSRKRVLRK